MNDEELELQHEQLLVLDEELVFDSEEGEDQPPTAYWIFLVYGLAMLLPWNVFITASDFFSSRFAPYHDTDFQNYFSAYFNWSNLISLAVLLLLFLNPAVVRIEIPLWINFMTFVFFAGSALITIPPIVYFWITIGFIVVAGITTSMLQASVLAEASQLHPKYMQAVMSGQGVAGVSVSLFSLLTIAFSSKGSAFYYFLFAILVTLVALLGRQRQLTFKQIESISLDRPHIKQQQQQQQIWDIVIRDIPGYICTMVLIYVVTLALFPSQTVQITSVSGIDPALFTSLHFLLFNVGDWIGRTMPLWKPCQVFSSRLLFIFALARTCFIPLFRGSSSSSNNDGVFFLLLLLFSISNGWLTSLVFMAAPQHQPQPAVIGTILSFFLVVGLALGGIVSFVL